MANNNFIKDNAAIIIIGVLAVGAMTKLLNPILELLGLSKDAGTINIENENTNSNSAWNPNFWRTQPNATILTNAAASDMINKIWNSVGYISDDFELVFSVFKQLRTKSQVSYLVAKFQEQKGKDLLTWLLGGIYPYDRYSSSEVNQLINYVNQLPK
jgi:hypothetical protein